MLEKIVSGGQTGVDRGALEAALASGFTCGGWCPAGRMAEDGPLAARFPLRELGGGYAERTRRNVLDSDGTLILHFGTLRGGTRLTRDECRRLGKPCLTLDALAIDPDDAAQRALRFVTEHCIRVLNVAGPRASSRPTAEAVARDVVTRLIELAASA